MDKNPMPTPSFTWYEEPVDDFEDWLSKRPGQKFSMSKRRERESQRRSRGTKRIYRRVHDGEAVSGDARID